MSTYATPPPNNCKRQSTLRFETLNAFTDHGMAGLTRSELATWLILFRDTKPNGFARVSLDDIARRAGMNRQTICRAIGKLKKRNMLQTAKRGGLNLGPAVYRVFAYPME